MFRSPSTFQELMPPKMTVIPIPKSRNERTAHAFRDLAALLSEGAWCSARPSRPRLRQILQRKSAVILRNSSNLQTPLFHLCTWYCDDEITRYSAIFAWFVVFVPAPVIAVSTLCFIWLDIVPCSR